MNEDDAKRSAASLAKTLAMMCVRNTFLEDLHSGSVPVTHASNFADVEVHHAEGVIPWSDVSRLDDDEMKQLMKQIVDRLYTFFLMADDPHFQEAIRRWSAATRKWDDPQLDQAFLDIIEQRRSGQAD